MKITDFVLGDNTRKAKWTSGWNILVRSNSKTIFCMNRRWNIICYWNEIVFHDLLHFSQFWILAVLQIVTYIKDSMPYYFILGEIYFEKPIRNVYISVYKHDVRYENIFILELAKSRHNTHIKNGTLTFHFFGDHTCIFDLIGLRVWWRFGRFQALWWHQCFRSTYFQFQ